MKHHCRTRKDIVCRSRGRKSCWSDISHARLQRRRNRAGPWDSFWIDTESFAVLVSWLLHKALPRFYLFWRALGMSFLSWLMILLSSPDLGWKRRHALLHWSQFRLQKMINNILEGMYSVLSFGRETHVFSYSSAKSSSFHICISQIWRSNMSQS